MGGQTVISHASTKTSVTELQFLENLAAMNEMFVHE
jgi:hypothetical protein